MNTYFKYFIGLYLLCFLHVYRCSENQRSLTLAESCAIGAVAAAGEVTFPGQILTYGMNQAIKKQKFVPFACYRGFVANLVGQMPIGAIQKIVQTKGSQFVEAVQGDKPSSVQKAAISYTSGICGAMVDTPSNAVQLFLQEKANAKKSIWQAMRELGCISFRGCTVNALMKEGPFALGYQMLAGQAEQVACGYVENPLAAQMLGGVGAGVLIAGLTQPGAVLRNKMQADLFNRACAKPYQTTWQTMQTIIKQDGFSGLWSGWKQRGIRVAFAVPLYATYSAALEAHMKK